MTGAVQGVGGVAINVATTGIKGAKVVGKATGINKVVKGVKNNVVTPRNKKGKSGTNEEIPEEEYETNEFFANRTKNLLSRRLISCPRLVHTVSIESSESPMTMRTNLMSSPRKTKVQSKVKWSAIPETLARLQSL